MTLVLAMNAISVTTSISTRKTAFLATSNIATYATLNQPQMLLLLTAFIVSKAASLTLACAYYPNLAMNARPMSTSTLTTSHASLAAKTLQSAILKQDT